MDAPPPPQYCNMISQVSTFNGKELKYQWRLVGEGFILTLCSCLTRLCFHRSSMLRQNGSAVDATVATLICISVVNTQSAGVGGGFLMTLYDRRQRQAAALLARETAPAAATEDMFVANPMESQYGEIPVTCHLLLVTCHLSAAICHPSSGTRNPSPTPINSASPANQIITRFGDSFYSLIINVSYLSQSRQTTRLHLLTPSSPRFTQAGNRRACRGKWPATGPPIRSTADCRGQTCSSPLSNSAGRDTTSTTTRQSSSSSRKRNSKRILHSGKWQASTVDCVVCKWIKH